ncbi:DNA-directed RNA polymerase [Nakaseomyces bracarensis]|uniref:DNA-directed RNA polymerase n=1 Tax=Nakaseomyces bracarensis TaxID=273131 RepID=UPI00387198E0
MLRPYTKEVCKLSICQRVRFISSKGSKLLKPSTETAINDLTRSSPANYDILRPQPLNPLSRFDNIGTISGMYEKSKTATLNTPFAPFNQSQAAANVSMSQTRDVMQLWSLLEACLKSDYFDRAYSILESLYQIESHRAAFIDDYNMYLLAFCRQKGNTHNCLEMTEKLLNDIKVHFPSIMYNDRTLAILMHHALSHINSPNSHHMTATQIQNYFKMNVKGKRTMLSNIDVLSVEDFKTLYFDLRMLDEQDIPELIRPMVIEHPATETGLSVENSASESDLQTQTVKVVHNDSLHNSNASESKNEKHTNDEIIEKNASELVAVDTIGMRTVRHALMGLSFTDEQKQKLTQLDISHVNNIMNFDESKSIDFFEMYKSLKSNEEKDKFDEMLNEFNHQRQEILERRATEAAKERWKFEFEEAKARGDLSIEKSLNTRLWEWYNAMLPLVKEELKRCTEELNNPKPSKKTSRTDYAPYFKLVNPEKMCVITILEILKLNSTGGVIDGMRTARAVISVSKAIELEFRSEQLLRSENQTFKDVNKKSHEFKRYVQSARKTFRSIQLEKSNIIWPQHVRAKIGSVLVSFLMHVAKISVEGRDPVTRQKVFGEAPAFAHTYIYHNGSKLGIIKIHKSLVNRLNGERLLASVQPQLLPMLVKPRPWKSWKSGGYLYTQSLLVRSRDSPEQLAYLKAVSESKAIDKVYDGLNVLGETGWTVNRSIFNVISQVWNEGKEFLDIPGIHDELKLIPPPPRDSDPVKIRQWKLQNKEITNKFSSDKSVRCDLNYKLEIARAFLGEKFYFPHNLDFRGRAYPLSPHFNHLGNDMSRGLLIFWKGKRLGPDGLKWLKVHLSNLFGVDKVPLEDREKFTEDHMDDIKDSAENPLNGKGWWKTADKPWQALATCMELNEAYKLENPEDFISHQPVHQDGTCNGLQHYSALGGDVEGATQVNLVPSDKPQDVYSYVAKLVEKRLDTAVAAGDEKAKILRGRISRKVVKQTVMTNVYGVTYVGATFQIAKQLGTMFDDRAYTLELSKYLTKHVFAAVRELFQGAHLIQDWLGDCAKKISKSVRLDVDAKSFKDLDKPDYMSSIIWTTPLGLPIVQPYRDACKKQVITNLQSIYITDPFAVNPINSRRQKAGFPPNFIHSLDASHMLLSATGCGESGLDFASVHDSYWTHACDVDQMNVILRNEFIKLHEVDLIQRLKEEFQERYRNHVQVLKIGRQTPLAKKILAFRSRLSKELGNHPSLADEIILEKKRYQLLNSTDPSEIEQGKNIETSISIIEESGEDLTSLESSGSEKQNIKIIAPLILPEIPPKGNYDVEVLRNSKYFFS